MIRKIAVMTPIVQFFNELGNVSFAYLLDRSYEVLIRPYASLLQAASFIRREAIFITN
jgi:hypothetical protein